MSHHAPRSTLSRSRSTISPPEAAVNVGRSPILKSDNSPAAPQHAVGDASVVLPAGDLIQPLGSAAADAERGLLQPADTELPPAVLSAEPIDGHAILVPSADASATPELQRLRTAFEEAARAEANSLRAVVRCGLLMLEAKKHAKRGEFEPWLNKHVFPDVDAKLFRSTWRKAQRWMDLTSSICAALGVLSGEKYAIPIELLGNATHVAYLPDAKNATRQEVSLADVLLLPSTALPAGAQEIQLRLFELIDGRTQRQLSYDLRTGTRPGGDVTPRDANGKRIQAAWGSKDTAMPEPIATSLVKQLVARLGMLRTTNQLLACNQEQFAALENEADLLGDMLAAARSQRRARKL